MTEIETDAIRVDRTNAAQLEAWDGDEGAYWAANAEAFDASVAAYHHTFLEAAAIAPDDRVLDIGCGSGQTTRDAARRATTGSALGVDLSARLLDVARRIALDEGVDNAHFEQADAQVHPFADHAFDVAISRTGAMFFGDPVAAFTNIARALRPGARIALLVWQPLDANPWISSISSALAAGRDRPGPPPDGPGPFSLSQPDRVRRLFDATGFGEPEFEGLSEPMFFGPDADAAFRLVSGLMGWMLQDLDDAGRTRALDDLRALFESNETTRGVQLGSATWLVTARRT